MPSERSLARKWTKTFSSRGSRTAGTSVGQTTLEFRDATKVRVLSGTEMHSSLLLSGATEDGRGASEPLEVALNDLDEGGWTSLV